MRSRINRHLGPMLAGAMESRRLARFVRGAVKGAPDEAGPPLELGGRDYAIFLLRVAAEIEHSLMVQYLFAAYSLGRPDAPAPLRGQARAWQETILGIAKEEMGHLVTVQNLLVALGGPLSFHREDYPHTSPFYPFGFKLRPASLPSLATYVCAESPEVWDDEEAQQIKEEARVDIGAPINRVGELYAELSRVLNDPALVPDAEFDADSVAFQATWDEWGRGYREGQRGREAMGGLVELPAPELLIVPAGSREGAVAALRAIGEQGEAFETPADENESHFRRFLAIYRAMQELGNSLAAVVRPVATNPTTAPMADTDPADPDTATPITHPEARLWAHLFNVRYRKLLVSLSHAFDLSNAPTDQTTLSPRGTLVHRCFAEMYHLRTIAGLIVRLPLDATSPDGSRAGPPFQMPYTLALPHAERDRWRLHRDVLDAAGGVLTRLKELGVSGEGQDYLLALAQADEIERGQVEQLIAGAASLDRAPTP
jgi:hypothetical protein